MNQSDGSMVIVTISLMSLGTAITEACLAFLKEQHFGKYPYSQLIHTNTQQASLDKVYEQV